MPTLFLAFLAAALASMGARDQLLVARLREALGAHAGLLVVGWGVAIAFAALAAWAGALMGQTLFPAAKQMLLGIALVFSAVELCWPRKNTAPAEPTRSLGAIAIVLSGYALTDAARFLVFAVAVGAAMPALAAIGGALGSGAALTLGWMLGAELAGWRWLRAMRLVIGVLLGITGLFLALAARGIV